MTNVAVDLRCAACGAAQGLELVEQAPPFSLYHCRACDVVFSDPLRNPGRNWYEDEDLDTRIRVLLASARRPQEMLREPHRRFLRHLPARGGRLLDVGCAEGGFLAVVRQWYDVTGLDFNRREIEIARGRYGLEKTYAMSLEEFAASAHYDGRGFDVVTLFDVIEHVEAPGEFLKALATLLVPGGWLALNTPNRHRRPNFKERWDYPPHHLTRWSKQALAGALERAGFTVQRMDDYTDPGYLTVAWMDRLAPVRAIKRLFVRGGAPGNGGQPAASPGPSLKGSVLNAVSKARYATARLVDRPILWALRARKAQGQMLFVLAQRPGQEA